MAQRSWHSFPIFVTRRTASPTANLVPIGRAASSPPRLGMFLGRGCAPSVHRSPSLSPASCHVDRFPAAPFPQEEVSGGFAPDDGPKGVSQPFCVAFRKERFQVDVPRGKEAPLGESVGGHTDAVAG